MRALVDQVLGLADSGFEVADYTLVAKLVRAGFACSIVPPSAVPDTSGLALIPIDDDRLVWTLAAATSTRRRRSAACNGLLEQLSAHADNARAAEDRRP